MGYIALIGLIFVPLVCLMCAGLFYVRWQNEENEEIAAKNKKLFRAFLIAAGASLVVFGVLKLIFPISI